MRLRASVSCRTLLLVHLGFRSGVVVPLGVLTILLLPPRPAAAGGPAVPPGTVVVCDSTDDRLVALTDRNGSGSAEQGVAGEGREA